MNLFFQLFILNALLSVCWCFFQPQHGRNLWRDRSIPFAKRNQEVKDSQAQQYFKDPYLAWENYSPQNNSEEGLDELIKLLGEHFRNSSPNSDSERIIKVLHARRVELNESHIIMLMIILKLCNNKETSNALMDIISRKVMLKYEYSIYLKYNHYLYRFDLHTVD